MRPKYCEKRFHKYYEFISCLCMGEQSIELLIKNHETCSIGSAPFLEVNATYLIYIFMIS